MNKHETIASRSPEETFEVGRRIGTALRAGDVVLLKGPLGAGKTLLTKGIVSALGFDADDVTSPSFALVNLYRTPKLIVYHIDLWRVEGDAAFAVGLDDLLREEGAVTVIEWADRLEGFRFPGRQIVVEIQGDGDDPRRIDIAHIPDSDHGETAERGSN